MSSVYDKILKFKNKYPGGVAWRIKKHAEVVEEYLNPEEKVKYAFCAQKNESFGEIFNTYAVALTNKRILLGHKRLFWGSFYYSITPDMYNDMQIYKGLIWGKIKIDTIKELVVLTNISKKGISEIETEISEFMLEAKKKYKPNSKKE